MILSAREEEPNGATTDLVPASFVANIKACLGAGSAEGLGERDDDP
jgi:hypothetical protein